MCFGIPSGLFPSGFLTKSFVSPMHATCPTHPGVVTVMIFGRKYKLLGFTVQNVVFCICLFQCCFLYLGSFLC